MAEENKVETSGKTPTTEELLATIKTMKENSVSRSDYEALKDDNKKLLDAIVNGQKEEEQSVIYSDEEVNALREKLFNTEKHDLSNLEYAQCAVQLRDAVLEKSEGKVDIFVGTYNKFQPTQEDYYRAKNTAETLKECINYAEGDSQLFTQELQRRMKQ